MRKATDVEFAIVLTYRFNISMMFELLPLVKKQS